MLPYLSDSAKRGWALVGFWYHCGSSHGSKRPLDDPGVPLKAPFGERGGVSEVGGKGG
jgi:hypothetical protein